MDDRNPLTSVWLLLLLLLRGEASPYRALEEGSLFLSFFLSAVRYSSRESAEATSRLANLKHSRPSSQLCFRIRDLSLLDRAPFLLSLAVAPIFGDACPG